MTITRSESHIADHYTTSSAAIEEVTFAALLHKLEKKTNRKSKKPPGFAKPGMSIIARLEVLPGAPKVCVERFEGLPSIRTIHASRPGTIHCNWKDHEDHHG